VAAEEKMRYLATERAGRILESIFANFLANHGDNRLSRIRGRKEAPLANWTWTHGLSEGLHSDWNRFRLNLLIDSS
jgi:hypothetical protein